VGNEELLPPAISAERSAHCGSIRYGQGAGEPNQSVYSAIPSLKGEQYHEKPLPYRRNGAVHELINEAMRRYGPKNVIDCKNPELVGCRLEVIAALWVYGTNPALDLVLKLRGCG